jgi:hypothetical protein
METLKIYQLKDIVRQWAESSNSSIKYKRIFRRAKQLFKIYNISKI